MTNHNRFKLLLPDILKLYPCLDLSLTALVITSKKISRSASIAFKG